MSRQYKNVTRGIGYGIEVRLVGDWARVTSLLGDVDDIIRVGSKRGKLAAAKKLQKIVKKHIRTSGGSLGWAPLSTKTIERKDSMGYDGGRILYSSGSYYRSIKVWSKGSKVYVGVRANSRNPYSKRTIGQIARILEYGSMARGIPARPLWLPSFKELGRNKTVKRLILWHVQNEFRIRHGISPQITL